MRTWAPVAAVAAATMLLGLGGCRRIDDHVSPASLTAPPLVARSAPRPRPLVKRVTRPALVPAGARIRSFCGQRHVRFQAGTLRETDTEKARNDVLCQQG